MQFYAEKDSEQSEAKFAKFPKVLNLPLPQSADRQQLERLCMSSLDEAYSRRNPGKYSLLYNEKRDSSGERGRSNPAEVVRQNLEEKQ